MQLQRETFQQVALWRHADSVWQVGGVPGKDQIIWEEFHVWTGFRNDTGQAYLAKGVINLSPGMEQYRGEFVCPRVAGRLIITDVTGELVHFATADGRLGVPSEDTSVSFSP